MKKIIIAVAIAVSAAFAQAAATNWQLTVGQMFSAADITAAFTGLIEVYASGGDLAAPTLVFSDSEANIMYNKAAFSTEALTAGQEYDFYVVLTEGNKQYTSVTKPGVALETGATLVSFGSLKTATQNAANWADVPEPTSGLLLLLGVAGLALKRKRA